MKTLNDVQVELGDILSFLAGRQSEMTAGELEIARRVVALAGSLQEAMEGGPEPRMETVTREAFESTFLALEEKSHGFVRICDLRRRMGWAREVFDDMLRRLRDDEVVQLHAGDVTLMTPEQVEDGFVDENGFRMGTMTWIGRRETTAA